MATSQVFEDYMFSILRFAYKALKQLKKHSESLTNWFANLHFGFVSAKSC